MRGNRHRQADGKRAHGGLSPRVRGNRRRVDQAEPSHGSIPARAGEPSEPDRMTRRTGVYPRACGGTVAVNTGGDALVGLSPRVRGNLQNFAFAGNAVALSAVAAMNDNILYHALGQPDG